MKTTLRILPILLLGLTFMTSCEKEFWKPEEPEEPMVDNFNFDPVSAPRYSVMAGQYNADQEIELYTYTESVAIYYTTDGTEPTTESELYTDPIPVTGNGTTMTIKAIAEFEEGELSQVSKSYYRINEDHDASDFHGGLSFEQIENNILGEWIGWVETPWVESYNADFRFNGDGTYTAHALTGTNHPNGPEEYWSPALYYGTDEDSDIKKFDVFDMTADGRATADITVLFHVGTTNVDQLRHIAFYNKGFDYLEFELWHHGQYGPVKFRLTRLGS